MNELNALGVKASSWKQLAYFKVFVNNDSSLQNARYPLLNNGNQQLLVTVRLAAQDVQGNFVPVSAAELNNIRLIDYGTSEVIPFGVSPLPWSTSLTSLGYTWDRSFLDSIRSLRLEQPQLFEQADGDLNISEHVEMEGPARISETAQELLSVEPVCEEHAAQRRVDYQTFQFYLRTTTTVSRRFAARIANSDGTLFRSNYSEVDNDDGQGDGSGKFNSSFEVEPISFPRLSSEQYGDRLASGYLKDTAIGNDDFVGKFRMFEHHVNIRMPNGRAVPIKTVVGMTGREGLVWACKGSGRSKWTTTYIAFPGTATTYYQFDPKAIGIQRNGLGVIDTALWQTYLARKIGLENKIKHPRAGEFVIGQTIGEENYYFYTSVTAGKLQPNQMYKDFTVIDTYGTAHNLRLGLIPEFNYLTLDRR